MIEKGIFEKIKNGLSYKEYMQHTRDKILHQPAEEASQEDKSIYEYTKLNVKRSERIDKTYQVSKELKESLNGLSSKQIWMVISEPWCGDSAQNLPFIAKMAEESPLIELKIILRDLNSDIMDNYLTNGTKSIPILVAFNEGGEELFKWGPRPAEAANLVKKRKEEGKTKDEFIEELHLWYGRNRGKAIETEFAQLLKK